MKRSILRPILISVLSGGWLLPLAWSADSYVRYLDLVLLPKLRGQVPVASAPLDRIALLQFEAACCWLFVAILIWSFIGYRAATRDAA
jgi:hypothetical protein